MEYIKARILIKYRWDEYYEEFLVPVRIGAECAAAVEVNRMDRQLPDGHRCRGDVGVTA